MEDYNDVFADIGNVLLFNGKEVILEDELFNVKDKSQYKAEDGVLHEQERDVVKLWKNGKIRVAICGFENQTKIDKDMPFRIIGYDGASYRSQLLSDNQERYPVMTLVLYFGRKRWKTPRSLYECLKIPKEMEPYVSDYKINIFEIAYLSDEQVQMFKSDFRIVADYFVQLRKNKEYQPSRDEIRHVDELLKLMSVLTNDDRYVKVQTNGKGKVKNMCEAMDRAEAKGRSEGRLEGELIGITKGELQGKIKAYTEMGLPVSEVAQKVGVSEEEVIHILESSK